MKLRLITLLAASAFLSACSSLPEAPQGQSNLK